MNTNETHPDEEQTPPDYDEYGDVPDSGDTSGTDEREGYSESPLG